MTTVRDLITGSLRDLGALGVAEVASADEANDALMVLNQMLGIWQTESLMVYSRTEQNFPYISGQRTYTVGPGGDLNIPRPIRIDAAYARNPQLNDLDIYVCKSFQDYADIVSKGAQSTLITAIYYDPTYPLGTLYVWPIPSDSSYSLVLWLWGVLSTYTSVNNVVSLPPGYELAIRANLAVHLSPRYGRPVSNELAMMANQSKAQLKRTNVDVPTMGFDRSLGGSGISFNYLTGSPT